MRMALAVATRRLSAAPQNQYPLSTLGSRSGGAMTGCASPATLTFEGPGSAIGAGNRRIRQRASRTE